MKRQLFSFLFLLQVGTLAEPLSVAHRGGPRLGPENVLATFERALEFQVDAIELDGELDVLALVEDEILLALPIAPRHQVCDAPQPEGGTSKESPFAALASLRGSHSAN